MTSRCKTMKKYSSSIFAAAYWIMYYLQSGRDEKTLLRHTGLSWASLKELNQRIDMEHNFQLIEFIYAEVKIPHLAFMIGAGVQIQDFGLFSQIFSTCRNGGELTLQTIRFNPLLADFFHWELQEGEKDFRFVYQPDDPQACYHPHSCEVALSISTTLVRQATGGRLQPLSLHFTHPKPAYAAEAEEIIGVPLYFDQPQSALVLPLDYAQIPTVTPESPLKPVYVSQAEAILKALPSKEGEIEGQVKEVILRKLPLGQVKVDLIAEELGYSRWTLNRRLAEESVSFQGLLRGVREALAKEYLKQGRRNQEIAYLLGYSETSAFCRAFKKWTGKSPQG